MKNPDETQIGRVLITLGLIIVVIYFIFGQDISIKNIFFSDEPVLIVVESYTNQPEWFVSPAIYDPQFFKIEGTNISNWLAPVPLLITVTNNGKNSVEETKLELEYPFAIKIVDNNLDNDNKLITEKLVKTNRPIKKVHELGTINPGESKKINGDDILNFENTINFSVNATTKDNVQLMAYISMVIGYPINYTIYTKNNKPVKGKFLITVGSRDYFINNTLSFTEFVWINNQTLNATYYKVYKGKYNKTSYIAPINQIQN